MVPEPSNGSALSRIDGNIFLKLRLLKKDMGRLSRKRRWKGQKVEGVRNFGSLPEVVDEYIRDPEVIEELEVNGGPLAFFHRVVRHEPRLFPLHSKIHGQGHAELLVVYLARKRR